MWIPFMSVTLGDYFIDSCNHSQFLSFIRMSEMSKVPFESLPVLWQDTSGLLRLLWKEETEKFFVDQERQSPMTKGGKLCDKGGNLEQ